MVSLLCQLVPVWSQLHPTHGEGLRHSVYRLSASYCCLDARSGSPYVQATLSMVSQPGTNR